MVTNCCVYRLGCQPYRQVWELQTRLAGQIARQEQPPTLLLLQHPHVFTFGRRGQIQNLRWDQAEQARRGVEVLWVDRGGDITYHGPGQLVGYPLLPLVPIQKGAGTERADSSSISEMIPKADYVGYLRKLEQVLILTLESFGLTAHRLAGKTGVWVQGSSTPEPAKIAAIGVKVDGYGVTRHGFSLNIAPDMSFWEGIVACGLAAHPIACMADHLEPVPSSAQVEQAVIEAFQTIFNYEMVDTPYELNG